MTHKQQYGGKYACETCNLTFTSESSLICHDKIHTGEVKLECKICKEKFLDVENYKEHVSINGKCKQTKKTKKNEAEPNGIRKEFVCNSCKAAFSDDSSLQKHIQRLHDKSLPHECLCGRRFATESELNDHQIVHTGEKPYGCSKCTKAFSSFAKLKKHLNKRHKK